MDLHEERVQMTIMTRNITSSANTVMIRMISALSEVRIHLEFLGGNRDQLLRCQEHYQEHGDYRPAHSQAGMVIEMALEAAAL